MKPKIDPDKCSNCGECVKICPVKHFKKDDNGVVKVKSIPQEPCLGCEACVINCPNEAITIEDD